MIVLTGWASLAAAALVTTSVAGSFVHIGPSLAAPCVATMAFEQASELAESRFGIAFVATFVAATIPVAVTL